MLFSRQVQRPSLLPGAGSQANLESRRGAADAPNTRQGSRDVMTRAKPRSFET